MASNTNSVFGAALAVLCLASCISAHNITRLLSHYPEFGLFNSLLSLSKVADEINRRQTIAVMAVDNSSAAAFSSLDVETLKEALSIHVILDYFDDAKLTELAKNTTLLTTLFQSSGVANDLMGFLNCTRRRADNRLLFGTAQPGAPLSSAFLKVVAVRPYNISVIQVTTAIVPPGLGGNPQEVPLAPPPAAAPLVGPTPADAPVAESPDESADAQALAPVAADGPAANAPASDSPADSPANSPTRAKAEDADVDSSSAAKLVAVGASGVVGALVLCALL